MSQPTYRIPSASVFLEADGTVVPRPADGATVLDAALDQAPALTAAYVGAGLQWLSEGSLGDSLLNDLGASSSTRAGLKQLVEFSEFLVLVGDLVELGVKIGDWMGLFGPPEPDPVLAILAHLDRRLSEIEDTVLQAWAASRRDLLAFLRAHSAAALRVAQEFLALGSPRTDPVWAAKIALADRDSLIATQALVGSGLDGGFWLRPFSLKAIGVNPSAVHSSWLGVYPDQAQVTRNPAWDYRFTLPAAAYAILARIAVLKAVAPGSLVRGGAGCREVRGYAHFLRGVAERMQGGIWAIEDLDQSETGRFMFLWNGRMPMAAANVYSGYGFFRVLYASEASYLATQDPALWPKGLVDSHEAGGNNDQIFARGRENARLIGRHWWHLVWRGIGMVEMCQLISDVESTCSEAPYAVEVGRAQKLLMRAQTDPGARPAVSAAAGLARLTSEGDAAADADRTYRLYRALREGGEGARQVVARAAEELLRLAPEEAGAPVPYDPED